MALSVQPLQIDGGCCEEQVGCSALSASFKARGTKWDPRNHHQWLPKGLNWYRNFLLQLPCSLTVPPLYAPPKHYKNGGAMCWPSAARVIRTHPLRRCHCQPPGHDSQLLRGLNYMPFLRQGRSICFLFSDTAILKVGVAKGIEPWPLAALPSHYEG